MQLIQVLEVAGFKADMRKIMVTLFKHNPGAQKLFREGLRYEKDDTSPKEEGKYDYEVWQPLSTLHLLKGHSLAKLSNIWPFYGGGDLLVEISFLKSLTYFYMKLQQKIDLVATPDELQILSKFNKRKLAREEKEQIQAENVRRMLAAQAQAKAEAAGGCRKSCC